MMSVSALGGWGAGRRERSGTCSYGEGAGLRLYCKNKWMGGAGVE